MFKLAYFDPAFVNEAAKGLGVIAEGKGKAKERGSHLTAKVRSVDSIPSSRCRLTLPWTIMLIDRQLLWAQKVWGFALPRIIEGDQDAKGG